MALLRSLPSAIALGLIWGIMAIGVYITYKVLDIADLTVDGSMVTGAAVAGVLIISGVNPWVAAIIAFLAGAACGLATGLFHTVMGIPALLAGILTQLMLYSVNIMIMKGRSNIPINHDTFKVIASLRYVNEAIGWITLICVVLVIVLYWFFGTERGTSLRATGDNLNMSNAQGVNTNYNKVLGLMISNGIVGFSGAILAQFNGASDINMGRGAIVIGLAAVIIGEAIVSKISRNFLVHLVGVIVGGIIYYIVYQVAIFLIPKPELLKLLSALIVAIFLAVPYWRRRLIDKGYDVKKLAKRIKKNTSVAVAADANTSSETETNADRVIDGASSIEDNAEGEENA